MSNVNAGIGNGEKRVNADKRGGSKGGLVGYRNVGL